MSFKKTFIVFSTLTLSGCFSTFFISDEEAIKLGREEGMTIQCLKYSQIPELRNVADLPNVGVVQQLRYFAHETIGSTVFGSGRFNYIKRDYLFQKSVENHQEIINQARANVIKPNKSSCKLYLDTYETPYYRLKAQGY
ncbi:hypothetical protein P9J70_11765 [Glaesserella parasuis]|uniref:hypothetical protein n=1 Tax=Glaesserella parasuis TaxID=738 RepID=UPI002436F494|nr:hypothetical protein [Glaesserella parasuis]MDG6232139.1 hypothetical protein [Glaesserella parasuis]